MNIKNLKKLVNDNTDAFEEIVGEEGDGTIAGVKFKTVSASWDNSEMIYIFQVEEKLYRLIGSYCSWGGTEYEDYTDFQEVKEIQVMRTEYKTV